MPQRTSFVFVIVLSQKMPPKNKKKQVHNHPEIHPSIIKNRERSRIQAAKKAARFLRMNKRKRKQSKALSDSTSIDNANIPESLQDVTSDEDNEVQENTYQPLSSSHQPGASRADGQEWGHIVDSNKGNKARLDHVSMQANPPMKPQFEDLKIQKNTAEIKNRRSNVSLSSQSTSQNLSLNNSEVEKLHKHQQAETQLGARSKIASDNKKINQALLLLNLASPTSVQDRVHVATETEVPMTQNQGFKQFMINFPETALVSSPSTPLTCSDAVKLQADEAKTKTEFRNTECARKTKGNETLSLRNPIKDTEFAKRDLRLASVQSYKKHLMALDCKKNLVQDKVEKIESMLRYVKGRYMQIGFGEETKGRMLAISGMITALSSNYNDKNISPEIAVYPIENFNSHWLKIRDKNIQISIFISKGTQVVCNMRGLETESWSQTLEGKATSKSDEDIISYPKHHGESTNDSSKENISCGAYPNPVAVSCSRILGGRATSRSDEDVMSDPKHREETNTDSSKENITSGAYSNPDDESCSRILEGKATTISDEDVISDRKHREETDTDSSTESSKENISSGAYPKPDDESCSRILEGKATTISDEDVMPDPKHREETNTDSSTESNKGNISCGAYPNPDDESCSRILEGKATSRSDEDMSDPKHREETNTDSSTLKSKESISAGPSSVKENIQKVCINFLKECTSACENLVSRIVNIKKK